MEMCYDGALVLPSSYAVMDEEEMTYVEGGGSLVINRKTIRNAMSRVWNTISGIGTATWLASLNGSTAKIAAKIGSMLVKGALAVGKAMLSLSGFVGWALTSAAIALAGVVLACATTIGIVYATNSTIRLSW